MAEVELQMVQLVNLAIGSPEAGAVNFNLLQKVLTELLKLTDLESVTVKLTASDAAKMGETVKPVEQEGGTAEDGRASKRFPGCGLSPEKAEELLVDVNQLKMDFEDLKVKVENVAGATETVPFQEIRASATKIDGLQDKLTNIEGLIEHLKDLDLGNQDMPLGQRLIQMQKLVDLHEDQLTKVNSILEEKLEAMDNQIKTLESDMGEMNEKINIAKLGGKKSTVLTSQESKMSVGVIQDQTANINNLISRLSSVQHDLDNLTMMTNSINEEGERKQMLIDALTEQVEMLKLAKADKTNMEDILAAKADMSQVHRKVSHDHFENKIEQLNAALEDAFTRLDSHEESWQEEVEELKSDLHNKLDKMEFSPLKDFVNDKLKTLQDKMKALAAQKREGLAAGSKRRILRDVQCISCDNESVMKPENTFDEMMPPPPLPTQPSVRPYLAYKLDQVRKQQKKLPGRNLLHFEEMLQNPADPRSKTISKSGEHIVNRFVGGSHTMTTPQQRVTRNGNFYETWGPIITAVDTSQPTDRATRQLTAVDSSHPTERHSRQLTAVDSSHPTERHTRQPTAVDSSHPTERHTRQPTALDSSHPTERHTRQLTAVDTSHPTERHSRQLTAVDSSHPTERHTRQPTAVDTSHPTERHTRQPTAVDTSHPTERQTRQLTAVDTSHPTERHTRQLTAVDTSHPTERHSRQLTAVDSSHPTERHTRQLTTVDSSQPSDRQTRQLTAVDSSQPTDRQTRQLTAVDSSQPTNRNTRQLTAADSSQSTDRHTRQPTAVDTSQPTDRPDRPTRQPTVVSNST